MRLSLRILLRTESIFLYVLLWICFLSVNFQSQLIPRYYATMGHSRTDKMNSNFTAKKNSDSRGPVTTPKLPISNTEVMTWFNGFPSIESLSLPLPKHPYLTPYTPHKDICRRGAVHLLIYIQSRPQNVENRDAMRKSWGDVHNFKSLYVERIFLIGKSNNKQIMEAVEKEIKQNEDIILCDFIDTYGNLSLKALTLLDFVNSQCSQAKYILKTDDDIFVNIYSLIELFLPQMRMKRKAVVCDVRKHSKATTDKKSRWYIPKHLLQSDSDKLPMFCSGYAVFFTSDLIPLLLKVSFNTALVQVDDVYLFGFLLNQVSNVTFIDNANTFSLNQEAGVIEYKDKNRPLVHVVIAAWESGIQDQLWTGVLEKLSPFAKEIINQALIPQDYW